MRPLWEPDQGFKDSFYDGMTLLWVGVAPSPEAKRLYEVHPGKTNSFLFCLIGVLWSLPILLSSITKAKGWIWHSYLQSAEEERHQM